MGLVWVTGNAGTGKSSVCAELQRLGRTAFDADWDGFCRWVDRGSGEVVLDPPYPVPRGWLERFGWRIDVESVRALAARAVTEEIYLCGSAENETDVLALFDRVVCLVADDQTLRRRLTERTDNAFGKHPEELAATLSENARVEAVSRERGAAVIDATQPLEHVVRAVLATGLRAAPS